MAKLTLDDLANLDNPTSAVATINSNNADIEAALENTLSRDGTSPNSMQADLDMNSHRILNLPAPLSPNEPARLVDIPTQSAELTEYVALAQAAAAAADASADAAAADYALVQADVGAVYDYIDAAIAANVPTVADGSITTNKIANNTITGNKLVAGTVTQGYIGTHSIDYTRLKTDTVADLKNIRNVLRIENAWDFYDLGMLPGSTAAATANTTAFQNGIYAARAAGIYKIIVPPGNWYINGTITIDYGLNLVGVHRLLSGITSLNIATILSFVGTYGTGGALKDVSIYYDLSAYAPGTIGGTQVYCQTSTGAIGAHGIIIERVRCTVGANNMYYYGILLDGSANTSGTPGARDCIIRDVDVFQIQTGGANIDIRQGRSVLVENVNGYATGPGTPISLLQVSGPNASYPSSGVKVRSSNFATIVYDHCNQCFYDGWTGTSGSLTANSSTSVVIQQGVNWSDAGTNNKLL